MAIHGFTRGLDIPQLERCVYATRCTRVVVLYHRLAVRNRGKAGFGWKGVACLSSGVRCSSKMTSRINDPGESDNTQGNGCASIKSRRCVAIPTHRRPLIIRLLSRRSLHYRPSSPHAGHTDAHERRQFLASVPGGHVTRSHRADFSVRNSCAIQSTR